MLIIINCVIIANMKQLLLKIFVIVNIINIVFTLKDSVIHDFVPMFIYLTLYTCMPLILGILLWLFLSERISEFIKIKNKRKHIIYFVLNSMIPLLALSIGAWYDWGNRLSYDILLTNYFDNYFSAFGFLIVGILPAVINIILGYLLYSRKLATVKNR